MTCPVCQRQNLPTEVQTCPQCDADLRGLHLLAALQSDNQLRTISGPASTRAWWPMALGVAALLGGGVLLGRTTSGKSAARIEVATESSNTKTASMLAVVRDSVRVLQKQVASSLPATLTNTGKQFTYVVRRGDTLRGIAWRLYGKAGLAEQLAQTNSIINPRRLPIGKRLQLLNL